MTAGGLSGRFATSGKKRILLVRAARNGISDQVSRKRRWYGWSWMPTRSRPACSAAITRSSSSSASAAFGAGKIPNSTVMPCGPYRAPRAGRRRPRSPRLESAAEGHWPNWLRHRSPKPAIPGSSPGCAACSATAREEPGRVHRLPPRLRAAPHLEVEVRGVGVAGAAHPADQFPARDLRAEPCSEARLVRVAGGDRPVRDARVLPVALLHLAHHDGPIACRSYRSSLRHRDVDALVRVTAPQFPEPPGDRAVQRPMERVGRLHGV